MDSKSPSFPRALVGTCYAQTAADRFGHDAKQAIEDRERLSQGLLPIGTEWPQEWLGSDSDDSDDDDNNNNHPRPRKSIFKKIPTMQVLRNNLTALSHSCNLYFAAYQTKIFVYVPRSGPKQSLPRRPDLQLSSRPSELSLQLDYQHSPRASHCCNHLIVGFLGQKEILLSAHDDGDAVAFYVKDIADYIANKAMASKGQKRSLIAPPDPFFHENVGLSAWGLAIHQQSRLIAVSSNRHEVTVFAPALAPDEPSQARACDCRLCCSGPEERVRHRARSWRIVLVLARTAANIPNINFLEDEDGNADKIAAIDIKGSLWIADIWKPFHAALKAASLPMSLLKRGEMFNNAAHGWGILALAPEHFLRVRTPEELVGASLEKMSVICDSQTHQYPLLDTAACLREVPDNPCSVTSSASVFSNRRRPPFALGFGPEPTDETADGDNMAEGFANDSSDDEGSELGDSTELDVSGGDTEHGIEFDHDDEPSSEEYDDDEDDASVVSEPSGPDFLAGPPPVAVEAPPATQMPPTAANPIPLQALPASGSTTNPSPLQIAPATHLPPTAMNPSSAPVPPNTQWPTTTTAATSQASAATQVPTTTTSPAVLWGSSPAQVPTLTTNPVSHVGYPPLFTATFISANSPPPNANVPPPNANGPPPNANGPPPNANGPPPLYDLPPHISEVGMSSGVSGLYGMSGLYSGTIPTAGLMPDSLFYATTSAQTDMSIQDFLHNIMQSKMPDKPDYKKAAEAKRKAAAAAGSPSKCLTHSADKAAAGLDMVYQPHDGAVLDAPRSIREKLSFFQRPPEYNEIPAAPLPGARRTIKRYHVIRLYEKDVEMRALKRASNGMPELGVLCRNALSPGPIAGRHLRSLFRATSRLNMVAHIPGLHLVVVASPVGRVLLITPTRLVSPAEKCSAKLHHGMRVDCVLPRRSDEAKYRADKRPLHGIAVGPVQDDDLTDNGGVEKGKGRAKPARYRLMLHYRNHEILSYEVSRAEQTGKICIF